MERQRLETPKENEQGSTETKKIRKSNRTKSKNTEIKEEQSINSNKEQEQKQEKDKGDKKESITKKRVRRSKRIKNALKNFKIYYQNVRGLKSKLDSLQEMIDDYQPALVCIVETHMQKEEEIQIHGYSLVYRNDRSANSGGMLIGVRDNIKNISLELTQENKVGQSLWILLTNTKKKIRIGVIYAPQENVTPNNELKLMYEDIRQQIKIGKEEKQQILVIGDFNAKIGEAVEGNKTQVTKGGRQLLKLANKENMIILNTVKEKCKGVWTRVQGDEKSIIDYVLTDASSANTVKEMKIDEEKQYGLHKLYKNTATNENRKIYSDHNSILINLDFDTLTEEERPKKIITKEGYKRYRTIIKEENVSELLKLGDLQESYNEWSIAIENSIKTVQKTRTKNPRKDIKELQKICKRLREEFSTTEELHEKILILQRIKTLKEHITEKDKEVRSKRINHIAQEIRENVDNGGKIWEVKRRLEKKVQTPHSITNAEGIKLQNRLDIQEEYKKYSKKLLKTKEPDNESERIIEEEVNKN